MSLTFGGKSLSATPKIEPKAMSHMSYGFWDAFITMGFRRNEAIGMWERMEDLRDRLEANPSHPKADAIRLRISALESKAMQQQVEFLKAEVNANRYWTSVDTEARNDEEWDEMIGVPANAKSIIPMWRNPMGSFDAPPRGFRMSNVVLQFATTAQIAAYSMGGTR